jgi:hypothetical protein
MAFSSTAPIGDVAPGRQQHRYVEDLVDIDDGEADRHLVEERAARWCGRLLSARASFPSVDRASRFSAGLGGTVPDCDEVVVVANLSALQANLQSVECLVVAVGHAKR